MPSAIHYLSPNKKPTRRAVSLLVTLVLLAGCTFGFDPNSPGLPTGGSSGGGGSSGNVPAGEDATVNRIIDGDTIDVTLNGQSYRIRYVGMNTPESDESCYDAAKQANSLLVNGKKVRLVKDQSEADQYGRLLRYVYADGIFVNAALVEQGYAEVVSYPPDTTQFNNFRNLEAQAKTANRGCHPTGIFNDGSDTR
jgi:endonuclease YncB( thermonuclease family)